MEGKGIMKIGNDEVAPDKETPGDDMNKLLAEMAKLREENKRLRDDIKKILRG